MSGVEKVTSPATSTPSSTPSPTRCRDDMLKDSELQDSDMSIIDSSMADTEKPGDEKKEELDEKTTLDGKSVEKEAQDASDSSWEEKKEEERKEAPKSSVAQRTRSKIGEKRKKETSLFLGDGDISIDSMLVESGTPMDSVTLNEENPWKNEMVWKKGIIDLNDTLDRASEVIKRGNNGIKTVREIRKYEAEPVVIDLENEGEETTKKKKVTFNIEYGKCSQVLEEVVKSLEMITGIDIDTTPRPQIERIIRILVSVCIDLYGQMQSAQITMGAMAELIEDLLRKGEEVEKIKRNDMKLKTYIAELKEQIEQHQKYNKHLSEFNRPETKQKEDLESLINQRMENDELKKEFQSLEEKHRKKVKEYEVAFAW